jgi:bifunctional non-homologous end joining protein LigD
MATKRATKKRAPAKRPAAKRSTTKRAATKRSAKKSPARKRTASKRSTRALAEYNRKRDFTRTKEPEGRVPARAHKKLQFVIQKHDARNLHYDLRLELDGVMKSWAVPKGPSLDPSTKRLAMEVEDHPIEYNSFEGTIPEGEYGGGTVMLWDRGTYEAEDGGGAASLRDGYERGDLKVILHGKRLHGSWVLVRMKRPGRPQWLLIKHRDDYADAKRDITDEMTKSVATRRSMEQIATGRSRVWHSNRS